MISHLGSGQALVPTAPVPDWKTWSSGGPVSHGSGNVRVDIEPHFVYAPNGDGLSNDIEGESGALWTGRDYGFTSNGVMMLGDSSVSSGASPVRVTANVISSVGPTVTMLAGAGAGAALMPQHRAVGAVVGALVGGIFGLIFSPG